MFLDRARRGAADDPLAGAADEPALAGPRMAEPWLEADGALTPAPERIAELLAAWRESARAGSRRRCASPGISAHGSSARGASATRQTARAAFEAEVAAGRDTIDVLRHPLLPYQRLGAMHLAFGERALLADDMGLGKTIQAIAACELLARRKGIERVLVVCPASLKAEWEEQIARFSTARDPARVRPARAIASPPIAIPPSSPSSTTSRCSATPTTSTRMLKPDIVVLDEAQRIKNWQTKTARRVKSLRAPHAFVLTGTPVENRIDELYSIVQYLDPEMLGPLFRFNRDFYELDERGRPIDYKNLAELRERVAPVMLRRRKADVETELPGRTVKTYFVAMVEEQKLRYEEYRAPAAQLLAQAQRRPLRSRNSTGCSNCSPACA